MVSLPPSASVPVLATVTVAASSTRRLAAPSVRVLPALTVTLEAPAVPFKATAPVVTSVPAPRLALTVLPLFSA